MKTLMLNNHEVRLYDSIDELPIVNFQKYNKYLLIDSGIGSDIEDFDAHITKLAKYIQQDRALAIQELKNMRQNLAMIISEISPKHLAFAALIYSIDNEVITDFSDEGLRALLGKLAELKQSKLAEILEGIKKKVSIELELYFPKEFIDAKQKEVYDKLKQRVIYELREIIEDQEYSQQLEEIDTWLFNLYKPQSFEGQESAEIKYDKHFEASCLLIAQKSSLNPRNMTVLQFYGALETIKKQLEAEAKMYKKSSNKC